MEKLIRKIDMRFTLITILALFLVSCAEETSFKEGERDLRDIFAESGTESSDPDKNDLFYSDPVASNPDADADDPTNPDNNDDVADGTDPANEDPTIGDICLTDPSATECQSFCTLNPQDLACIINDPEEPIDFCVEYPNSTECQTFCMLNPTDETCVAINDPDVTPGTNPGSDPTSPSDCASNPSDPACQLYCDLNPSDDICNDNDIVTPEIADSSENFTQNENSNKVDILWVVDNSGSMKDEQSDLATNFESFIDSFVLNNTNYKMAITTTDGGWFVGDSDNAVLDSSMDHSFIKNSFQENIQVGTMGSGAEEGLASAAIAIERMSTKYSLNYNFLREDAAFAVIIVSDENDLSPNSTLSYIEEIRSAKSDPNKVAIYSIVDTVAESYEDPFTSPINMNLYGQAWINPGGLRYMNASNYTGGFSEDIHGNFADSLINIGGGIAELAKSFALANEPIINTIVVTVNGVVNTDWIYDDATQSIIFNNAPAEGAAINVDYSYIK